MQNTTESVQSLSESFHDGLDTIDKLQIENLERAIQIRRLRITGGMRGDQGAKTIRRQAELIETMDKARQLHLMVHFSAQKDAETMAWPFECPENAGLTDDATASAKQVAA